MPKLHLPAVPGAMQGHKGLLLHKHPFSQLQDELHHGRKVEGEYFMFAYCLLCQSLHLYSPISHVLQQPLGEEGRAKVSGLLRGISCNTGISGPLRASCIFHLNNKLNLKFGMSKKHGKK